MAELWLIWISLFLLSLVGLAGVAAIVGAILWWSARMTRRKSRQVKGATKVTAGFNAVLDTYTQIKAVSLWTNSTAWFVVDSFPYDCLIRPGTTQATALQAVISAHPGQFVTCIRTTGNVIQPNCTP